MPAPRGGGGACGVSQFVRRPSRVAGWSGSLMRVGVSAIVQHAGTSCQLDLVRFTPVRAARSSCTPKKTVALWGIYSLWPHKSLAMGVTDTTNAAGGSNGAARVGESGAYGANPRPGHGAAMPLYLSSSCPVSASAAPLVHPLSEFVDNSVDEGPQQGVIPSGGTGIKIVAHRAGVPRVIRAERALSTGRPVQGRRMDEKARVLSAEGGVRFGVYTGPMTQAMLRCSAFAVSAAPVGAVGR